MLLAKVSRRIGGGDQADMFNLNQNNSHNTSVHLKVDEEPWRIAQGSKRQASGYGPHVRNLSQGYGTQILLMHSKKNTVHALDRKTLFGAFYDFPWREAAQFFVPPP